MTQTCTVCRHPERTEIEVAVVRGASYRDISGRFDLSKSAIGRHATAHLPAAIARAAEAEGEASADTILAQITELRDAALTVLRNAQELDEPETVLKAVREAKGCVELLARVLGELKDGPTVNVLVSAEWVQVQGAIMGALVDHPQARVAVAGALKQLEAPANVAA